MMEEIKYTCKTCGKKITDNYFYDGIYGNIFCLLYCSTEYYDADSRYNFTSIDFRKEASHLSCPSKQRKKEKEETNIPFTRFEIMEI